MQLISHDSKDCSKEKKLNFAAENVRQSTTKMKKLNAAEGVRDVFGRILMVASNSQAEFDSRHLLRYPITTVPLSLAHSDGTPLKTDKAVLTKTLLTKQKVIKAILHCNSH